MAAESDPGALDGTGTAPDDGAIEVLEFALGDTRYCTRISYVAEVVETDPTDLTAIPNAGPAVEGVLDLRGQTTTIVDPKRIYEVDDDDPGEFVLVFDRERLGDDGSLGWLVDSVEKVSHVEPDNVDERDRDDGVEGIVNRDEAFLIWADPAHVVEQGL